MSNNEITPTLATLPAWAKVIDHIGVCGAALLLILAGALAAVLGIYQSPLSALPRIEDSLTHHMKATDEILPVLRQTCLNGAHTQSAINACLGTSHGTLYVTPQGAP